ncbi:hypothetical protein BGX20_004486 [Mortierella sp. AD010]|nr:hypothetical protein BGX20_004486 [Mortierella sp. AD010]
MNNRYSHTGIDKPMRRVASGLATVMPGEPGAKDILAEAFTTLGLSGIKMHSHVQCVPANHPSMDEVYETCIQFDKPVLIHAGKEPNSSAYKVDAGKICDVSIVEDVLTRYPNLRMCVPHLGMNQYQEFFDLLDKFPNLYLDTTMTFGAFFRSMEDDKPFAQMMRTMLLKHCDRILYGTDWPNIPYDWSRELANLIGMIDGDGEATSVKVGQGGEKGMRRTVEGDIALEKILWRNASAFYGISEAELGHSNNKRTRRWAKQPLEAVGGAGSYFFFTNKDLPNRTINIEDVTLEPLASGKAIWYYVAAVSVFAAAVGLFGIIAALTANRRTVKAFEALYFFSLISQLALIIWGLIWCKQNQTEFDTMCDASKNGLVDLPIPSFASSWTCQKIYMAGMLTIGIGGFIWIAFNFYMTNRVIHYARELFNDKANRYKVLGEAAVKELDREQQIPLNYTNVGTNRDDQEYPNNTFHQPSYRDEIEYKDPRSDDSYHQPRASVGGFGSYGQEFQQNLQHPVAPGFNHRDSAMGLDLVNPYHGEQDIYPTPIAMENIPHPSVPYLPQGSGQSANAYHGDQNVYHVPIATENILSQDPHPSAPNHPQGSGQSFVHTSTSKIVSPFDDDDSVSPVHHSSHDDVKVPLPASPRGDEILLPLSPTQQTPSADVLSPTIGSHSGSQ